MPTFLSFSEGYIRGEIHDFYWLYDTIITEALSQRVYTKTYFLFRTLYWGEVGVNANHGPAGISLASVFSALGLSAANHFRREISVIALAVFLN